MAIYEKATAAALPLLSEQHLYGSQRLGILRPTMAALQTAKHFVGLKEYELNDHLGNVSVTLSDYGVSNVRSAVNYYPFGMMARSYNSGRKWSVLNINMKMDNELKQLVEVIFSDADIVDIDLSCWDKYITIIVIADHLKSSFSSNRRPVFNFKFHSVHEFKCNFYHNKDNAYKDDLRKHYRWPVDRFEIKSENSVIHLELKSGYEVLPILNIAFEKLEVQEFDMKIIDKITPKWFEPNNPFARRSLEEIYQSLQGKKGR